MHIVSISFFLFSVATNIVLLRMSNTTGYLRVGLLYSKY